MTVTSARLLSQLFLADPLRGRWHRDCPLAERDCGSAGAADDDSRAVDQRGDSGT